MFRLFLFKDQLPWHDALTKKHQTRRGNKYGAQKVTNNAHTYDSKLEHETHAMLKLLQRALEICNIRHHPPALRITPHVSWKVDFIVYDHKLQCDVGIEAKGLNTERFNIIRQLLKDFAPMPIRIYKKHGNRIYLHEEFDKKI